MLRLAHSVASLAGSLPLVPPVRPVRRLRHRRAAKIIGQRLKLSGMHWSQPGATGILTLRCQQANGRREEIW